MATRSHIYFCERQEGVSFNEHHQDKVEFMIYNHYDSHPHVLGVTLGTYLDESKFHDMGCLAAGVVGKLKMTACHDGDCIPKVGDVYLVNPNCLIDSHGYEEYTYYIWTKPDCKEIWISVFNDDICLFVGPPRTLQTKYDN